MPGRHDLSAGNVGAISFAVENLRAEVTRLQVAGKQVHLFLSPHRRDLQFEDALSREVVSKLRAAQIDVTPVANVLQAARGDYHDGVQYAKPGHEAVAGFLVEMITPGKGKGP